MANTAKSVANLSIASSLTSTDRVVVLVNPASTSNVKTANLSVVVAALPAANTTAAGTVKVGEYLSVNSSGFLNGSPPSSGVTSVVSGNGIVNTTITSTGTISVLANTGLVANTTGVHVDTTTISTVSYVQSLIANYTTTAALGSFAFLSSLAFSSLTSKPTTLAGYGITDGITTAAVYSMNSALSAPATSYTGTWITGGTATTNKPHFLIEPTGTTSTGWSTAGTGLGINAATGFTGNLIDLQIAGASYLSVSTSGGVTWLRSGAGSGNQLGIGNYGAYGSAPFLTLASSGRITATVVNGFQIQGGPLELGGNDCNLTRDAANTLALRNGTNAQTFRVYNTYTDASNNEYFRILWSANTVYLTTQASGTGTLRDMIVCAGSNLYFGAGSAAANQWRITTSGHFLATTDNTYDIGASGATRPRSIYVAANVFADNGIVRSDIFDFVSKTRISAPSDGLLLIRNNASTDFNRLQFGGTTSSFPALKRSSTVLQARLADDSDFAPLQGRLRVHANAASETPTATHTLRIFDAAGTEYKVLCVAA